MVTICSKFEDAEECTVMNGIPYEYCNELSQKDLICPYEAIYDDEVFRKIAELNPALAEVIREYRKYTTPQEEVKDTTKQVTLENAVKQWKQPTQSTNKTSYVKRQTFITEFFK
jgi:hypothetical protein